MDFEFFILYFRCTFFVAVMDGRGEGAASTLELRLTGFLPKLLRVAGRSIDSHFCSGALQGRFHYLTLDYGSTEYP
jgi:hypothetical protein